MNTYQTPNLDTSWEQLKEIVQEQAELIRTLQAQTSQKKCECHIMDPSKMRVLLWINRHKNGKPDTCVLKIAEQRLLGLPRSDRRGETYWRFDEIMEVKKEEAPQTSFKCSECKEEVLVIGSDNPAEEIRQREALKKELAQMEVKEEIKEEKPEPQTENPPDEEKSARQVLKEQIAQALKENKQAEKPKTKENESVPHSNN